MTRVDRKRGKVVVEGRNLVKKTVKRTEDNPGGIITKEAPLAYSNRKALAVERARGRRGERSGTAGEMHPGGFHPIPTGRPACDAML